jgi:hypothetical protein
MLSVTEVHCPHCGAKGKILLPSQGAILIGPCPNCDEMVAVFCGNGLPLDKDVMTSGTVQEKHRHLMEVLTSFLDMSIRETLKQQSGAKDGSDGEGEIDLEPFELKFEPGESEAAAPASITDADVRTFRDVDLKFLDNKTYFDSIFRK